MRDAAGEPADRLHLLRVAKLGLHPLAFGQRAPSICAQLPAAEEDAEQPERNEDEGHTLDHPRSRRRFVELVLQDLRGIGADVGETNLEDLECVLHPFLGRDLRVLVAGAHRAEERLDLRLEPPDYGSGIQGQLPFVGIQVLPHHARKRVVEHRLGQPQIGEQLWCEAVLEMIRGGVDVTERLDGAEVPRRLKARLRQVALIVLRNGDRPDRQRTDSEDGERHPPHREAGEKRRGQVREPRSHDSWHRSRPRPP